MYFHSSLKYEVCRTLSLSDSLCVAELQEENVTLRAKVDSLQDKYFSSLNLSFVSYYLGFI